MIAENIIVFFGGFLSLCGIVLTTIGFKLLLELKNIEVKLTGIGKELSGNIKDTEKNSQSISKIYGIIERMKDSVNGVDIVTKSHIRQIDELEKKQHKLANNITVINGKLSLQDAKNGLQ